MTTRGMMRHATTKLLVMVPGTGAGWATSAAATEPVAPAPTAADYNRLSTELARVQQQLREQRALILQVMEMHSVLLRYMQSAPPGSLPALPPPGSQPAAPAPMASAPATAAPATEAPAPAAAGKVMAAPTPAREGTVNGTVHANTKDAALAELYVYVDGPRGGPAHPPTVEIKQKDRRFSPAVTVVPVNTKVLFPNVDKVFHNVFSVTPGAAFDLGTVKSGEKPSPTLMTKPGHVEVFCNIHSKMRADILVVPNTHWARVRPDGTFQIPGVPVGSHRLVLWGPTVKPIAQRIDVTGAGTAAASFTAEPAPVARHMNKQGAEYGSYEE